MPNQKELIDFANKMEKNPKICYLCGKVGADSKDHCPPKYLFYKKLPYDLIKLPAHESCQVRYSLDEEYFVTMTCTGSWANNAAWAKYWNDVSPRLREPNKKGFRQSLKDSLSIAEIRSKSGIILGKADIAQVDTKRINNVIVKIIRGLHFHHFQELLSDNITINIKSNFTEDNLFNSFKEDFNSKSPSLPYYTTKKASTENSDMHSNPFPAPILGNGY